VVGACEGRLGDEEVIDEQLPADVDGDDGRRLSRYGRGIGSRV
jgi:hypothetical protein